MLVRESVIILVLVPTMINPLKMQTMIASQGFKVQFKNQYMVI